MSDWKKENPLKYKESDGKLRPQYVVEKLREHLDDDDIICTEVGQNQMWAAQFYNFRKSRKLITSGGLGTMGFGLPAAIGAQLGFPDKKVWDIAGDGSIQMNIQELATAVKEKIPVKVAILNNGYLGMVRQWQELFFNKRYSGTCLRRGADCPADCDGDAKNCAPYVPDFVKLAEAYGAKGIRVVEEKDVEAAIKEANEYDGPVMIEFIVEPEENVWPMVPAGKAIKEMIGD